MSEEKNVDPAIELFLHADRKIDKVVADVGELIKKDLGLDHKMDRVLDAQATLKEGFDHSRTTGHKTWEAVQKMSAAVETLSGTIKIQEGRILTAEKLTDRVDKRFDKIILGIIVTTFCSILLTVMVFLLKAKS